MISDSLKERFSLVMNVRTNISHPVPLYSVELIPIPPQDIAYIRHTYDVMMRRRWGSVLPRKRRK
jgi:hypothetical protein